jgi:hypothetical protein
VALSDSRVTSVLDEIGFLDRVASHRLFEDLLASYYIPLEVWYTRTIIDKVHDPPLTLQFQYQC